MVFRRSAGVLAYTAVSSSVLALLRGTDPNSWDTWRRWESQLDASMILSERPERWRFYLWAWTRYALPWIAARVLALVLGYLLIVWAASYFVRPVSMPLCIVLVGAASAAFGWLLTLEPPRFSARILYTAHKDKMPLWLSKHGRELDCEVLQDSDCARMLLGGLSEREREIAQILAEGFTGTVGELIDLVGTDLSVHAL